MELFALKKRKKKEKRKLFEDENFPFSESSIDNDLKVTYLDTTCFYFIAS